MMPFPVYRLSVAKAQVAINGHGPWTKKAVQPLSNLTVGPFNYPAFPLRAGRFH
jgi:hypothetical protein